MSAGRLNNDALGLLSNFKLHFEKCYLTRYIII